MLIRLDHRAKTGWRNSTRFEVRNHRTGGREIYVVRNTLTLAWFNAVVDAMKGDVTDLKIKYIAVGTGETAPTEDDTQLEAEVFRKAVTSQLSPGDGVLQTLVYLAPNDANAAIREVGWFAGATATAAANSGILVGRLLWSHDKDASESIQTTRTDTQAEVAA